MTSSLGGAAAKADNNIGKLHENDNDTTGENVLKSCGRQVKVVHSVALWRSECQIREQGMPSLHPALFWKKEERITEMMLERCREWEEVQLEQTSGMEDTRVGNQNLTKSHVCTHWILMSFPISRRLSSFIFWDSIDPVWFSFAPTTAKYYSSGPLSRCLDWNGRARLPIRAQCGYTMTVSSYSYAMTAFSRFPLT